MQELKTDLPTLTLKQDLFYRGLSGKIEGVELGNASAAYRNAYDCSRMNDNSIHCAAFELMKNPKIAHRLERDRKVTEVQDKELQDMAREHTKIALGVLVDVMNDKEAPASARVQASTSMIDRGWGKPISKTEVDANINRRTGTVDEMSDDELIALLQGDSAAH